MGAGRGVGGVDDVAHRALVDALLAEIRRQRDRRLVERLAFDDGIAAGELLGKAAHVHAGKNDLRARGADVDADREEREAVLLPERVRVGIEIGEVVVVVIVLVVRLLAVLVHAVHAEQVVLQGVGRALGDVSHGRVQILKLSSVSGAKSSSGARRRLDSPCSWW